MGYETKNWNGLPLGKRAIGNLIAKPAYAAANIGFRTGKLVAIDIDSDDVEIAYRIKMAALGMLGETPFRRVGSDPRMMLFYRLEAEVVSRQIGKVEVLSQRKIALVYGTHPGTNRPYFWPEDSLIDFEFTTVPLVRAEDIDMFLQWVASFQDERIKRAKAAVYSMLDEEVRKIRQAESEIAVQEGERNNTLFQRLKDEASRLTSLARTLAVAERINSNFERPLPEHEVKSVAGSVWRYRREGTLMTAGKQSVVLPLGKDELLKLSSAPHVVYLIAVLKATRKGRYFTIPQKGTAKRLRWGVVKLNKAINVLIKAGIIRVVSAHPLQPTSYEWAEFYCNVR